MISGINEKRLSKKYHVNVRPFPGASANDMHQYLGPLLQKCPIQLFYMLAQIIA